MPEYRLSPNARKDMQGIWLYSLAQWGVELTKRYIDDLTEAFGFLTDSPKVGASCESIRAGYRKYPVNRHVIYYREQAYGVEVIRVLHDRRSAPQYF